jgi:hypothetical protein
VAENSIAGQDNIVRRAPAEIDVELFMSVVINGMDATVKQSLGSHPLDPAINPATQFEEIGGHFISSALRWCGGRIHNLPRHAHRGIEWSGGDFQLDVRRAQCLSTETLSSNNNPLLDRRDKRGHALGALYHIDFCNLCG